MPYPKDPLHLQTIKGFLGARGVKVSSVGGPGAVVQLARLLFDVPSGLDAEQVAEHISSLSNSKRRKLLVKNAAANLETVERYFTPKSSGWKAACKLAQKQRWAEKSRQFQADIYFADKPEMLAPPEDKPPTERALREFYDTWDWKKVRYEVLRDRGRRCECCNAAAEHGVRIVVDHIKPVRFNWSLRLSKGNLQVLCDDCNKGKSYHDETDWRVTV